MTFEKKDQADNVIAKLFKNLLIADAQVIENQFDRMYMKYKKEVENDD